MNESLGRLIDSMTSEQQAVVRFGGDHAVVSAVAGSGKTTVLVARILHLIDQGADPRRILVLMFNSAAADQFRERMRAAAGGLPIPEILTFHSFGLRLYNRLAQAGFLPERTLSTDDQAIMKIARDVLSQCGEDPAQLYEPDRQREFLEEIERAKNLLAGSKKTPLPEGFAAFEAAREAAGVLTFADLVYQPARLVQADKEAARFVANRYDYLMVDEAQDVAPAQRALIRTLAGSRARVMAVGDEDQAIYAWRGASAHYLVKDFFKDFAGAERLMLTRTFRYGHALCLSANHLILRNRGRLDKFCLPGQDSRTAIDVRVHAPDASAGQPVLEAIQEWTAAGGRRSDCTVLVRQFAQTVPIEIACLKAGVPFRLHGGRSFLEREETLHLLGVLLVAGDGLAGVADAGLRERVAFALLNYLFLPLPVRRQLAREAALKPERFLAQMNRFARDHAFPKPFQALRFKEAAERWHKLAKRPASAAAGSVLSEYYRESDLFTTFEKSTRREYVAQEKIALCREVALLAREGRHSVASFCAWLLELPQRLEALRAEPEAVAIRSCHSAKGLEFPHTIVAGLADGRFPAIHTEEDDTPAHIEDERRLFYVAMTRAQKRLTLVAPADEQLAPWTEAGRTGHPDLRTIKASRFLYEANPLLSARAGDAIANNLISEACYPRHKKDGATISRYFELMGVAV